MKRKESKSVRVAETLDMPLEVMCDFPKIEIIGNCKVFIENFRGVLDYNENCIKVNTTVGIAEIIGTEIIIDSITDDEICLKGNFESMRFI